MSPLIKANKRRRKHAWKIYGRQSIVIAVFKASQLRMVSAHISRITELTLAKLVGWDSQVLHLSLHTLFIDWTSKICFWIGLSCGYWAAAVKVIYQAIVTGLIDTPEYDFFALCTLGRGHGRRHLPLLELHAQIL